jgi:hypothetical protein
VPEPQIVRRAKPEEWPSPAQTQREPIPVPSLSVRYWLAEILDCKKTSLQSSLGGTGGWRI